MQYSLRAIRVNKGETQEEASKAINQFIQNKLK